MEGTWEVRESKETRQWISLSQLNSGSTIWGKWTIDEYGEVERSEKMV